MVDEGAHKLGASGPLFDFGGIVGVVGVLGGCDWGEGKYGDQDQREILLEHQRNS